MTAQQRADLLLSQWQLLWPLPAAERKKRFAEIINDYEFEETLGLIALAMLEPETEPYKLNWNKLVHVAGAVGFCVCFWIPIGIVLFEAFR